MCEQRYDDRERLFLHITHPELCIPESIRDKGFPPIYPFERYVYPHRASGPNSGPKLVAAVNTGPTTLTIGTPNPVEKADDFKLEAGGRGRPRRMAAVKAATATAAASLLSGPSGSNGSQSNGPGDRTIVAAAGGGIITSATVEKLPSETSA